MKQGTSLRVGYHRTLIPNAAPLKPHNRRRADRLHSNERLCTKGSHKIYQYCICPVRGKYLLDLSMITNIYSNMAASAQLTSSGNLVSRTLFAGQPNHQNPVSRGNGGLAEVSSTKFLSSKR